METELFIQWCPKQNTYVLMLGVLSSPVPPPQPNEDILADLYSGLWEESNGEPDRLELMDLYNHREWSYYFLKARPEQAN